MTSVIQKMDPARLTQLAEGVGAFAAVLGTAGAGALIAAIGPVGWLTVGLGVLGGELAAFRPQILTDLANGFHTLDAELGFFFGGLKRWFRQLPASPGYNPDAGDNIGALPQAFHGSGMYGGSLIKAALTDGGSAGRVVAGSITGGISNSNVVILGCGGGLSGMSGLGGALGGGGFGGGGHWSGKTLALTAGIGHAASATERAAYIRAYAAHLGMDPDTALRVSQSEGFYKYVGDHGMSFGDFQMFTGGGLGNAALKAGIDVRDPKQWRRADAFALEYAKRHGWGSWYGAGRVGISNWQGIDAPPRPPRQSDITVHLHHKSTLNGRVVADEVTRHQVRQMKHAGGLGSFDDYSMRAAAGQSLFPA